MANNRRWVIALSNRAACIRAARELTEMGQPALTASDGLCALELVRQEMPDLLACDLMLPVLEGAALMEKVQTLPLPTLPWAIGLCPEGVSGMPRQAALKAGACGVLEKPITASRLILFSKSLLPMQRLPRKGITRNRIEQTLWSLGFSASVKGTRYLAAAVDLCLRDAALLGCLTGTVYPYVAGIWGDTPDQVQHAIRRSVESAWSNGPRDLQYKLFGNTIDAKRGKPTAGEMIARMAELLRTGMEIEV